MAKTAAFGADNVLIAVYDSGKAAKAALKGQKDIVYATAANFAELNKDSQFVDCEGEILTVDTLFPGPEKKEPAADGTAAPRVRVKLEGEYHVVKDNGTRFGVEDERGAVQEALLKNTTFDGYFADAPEKITFATSRGNTNTISAANWAHYALRRGWIKMGPAPEGEPEPEAEPEPATSEQ